jgi:hypothetical protein
MIERIQNHTVLEETEVQVGRRLSDSGPAHFADALARLHLIADLHVVAPEVGVKRHDAIAMVDLHEQSPRAHVSLMNDHRAPWLEGNVGAALPVHARECHGACGDGAHGLA